MVVGVTSKLHVLDVRVTLNWAQKVCRQRPIAGDGGIDAGGQEIRPIVCCIQVSDLHLMTSNIANIGNIKHRFEAKILLDFETPVVDGRRPPVVLNPKYAGRTRHQLGGGQTGWGRIVSSWRLDQRGRLYG